MNIRALMTAVVVMGVLIVAGVATLIVTAFRRLSVPPAMAATVLLDEPQGTHMQSISAAGDRIGVLLQGGGPDRIVLLEAHSGKVVGRIGLVPER